MEKSFNFYYSSAIATDGTHIVDWAAKVSDRRGVIGPRESHAMVWDAETGRVIADLFDGKPIVALGVNVCNQVGYELCSKGSVARMWNGTRGPVVDLHPTAFDISSAVATEGNKQVGTVGVYQKSRQEVHRGVRVLMTYATLWAGTRERYSVLPYLATGCSFSASGATGNVAG